MSKISKSSKYGPISLFVVDGLVVVCERFIVVICPLSIRSADVNLFFCRVRRVFRCGRVLYLECECECMCSIEVGVWSGALCVNTNYCYWCFMSTH
jgi:hypothetical protein